MLLRRNSEEWEAVIANPKGEAIQMSGGTISGNSADSAGGVLVNGDSFTMSGGTISGNTASNVGGGVGVGDSRFMKRGGGTIDATNSAKYGRVVSVSDGDKERNSAAGPGDGSR